MKFISFLFIVVLFCSNAFGEEKSSNQPFIIRMCDSPSLTSFPSALPSLLEELNNRTNVKFDTQPRFIKNFEDELIFSSPLIYVKFSEKKDWNLSEKEIKNLKRFLEMGGFLWINSASVPTYIRRIKAEESRIASSVFSQPEELGKVMKEVLPDKTFEPIPHKHPINNCFYDSCPDTSKLPDEIIKKRKWPDFAAVTVGITIDERLAVVCTKPQERAWAKDSSGKRIENNWRMGQFFPLETKPEIPTETPSCLVKNSDGKYKTLYFYSDGTPCWLRHPGGKWYIYRYFAREAVNEYVYEIEIRHGINIIMYSLTH